jgi:hypothetical protein
VRIPSRVIVGWIVASLAWAVVPASWADDAKPSEPLESLGRFVGGAWVAKGDGSSDPHFRTRVVYEWGINRKLLKIKSYLTGEKDGEKLVYETVVFWHPEKKKIVFNSISADGSIFDGTMECRGDTYESNFQSISSEKTTTYRQTIQFLDDNTTRWTVLGKQGNDWVKVIESQQHREGAEAEPKKPTSGP